jgi:predicted GNAT family acetyltransferase
MAFTVTRYSSAAEFLNAAEPYLLKREALNSLMLGVVRAQARQATRSRGRPPADLRRRLPAAYLLVGDERAPLLAGITSGPRKFMLAWNETAGDKAIVADQAIAALVQHLLPTHRGMPSVFGPAELTRRFAEQWRAATDCVAAQGMRQRLFKLEQVTFPPSLPPGHLRAATGEDSALLAEWVLSFQSEAVPEDAGDLDAARIIVEQLVRNRDLYVWAVDNGGTRPTAMAARARPTVKGVAVNLVYTPPEERRHGYATACVAYLSQLLLQSGWSFCTLFTDRGNATANHIYERLGYAAIADFDEYRFSPARFS